MLAQYFVFTMEDLPLLDAHRVHGANTIFFIMENLLPLLEAQWVYGNNLI